MPVATGVDPQASRRVPGTPDRGRLEGGRRAPEPSSPPPAWRPAISLLRLSHTGTRHLPCPRWSSVDGALIPALPRACSGVWGKSPHLSEPLCFIYYRGSQCPLRFRQEHVNHAWHTEVLGTRWSLHFSPLALFSHALRVSCWGAHDSTGHQSLVPFLEVHGMQSLQLAQPRALSEARVVLRQLRRPLLLDCP